MRAYLTFIPRDGCLDIKKATTELTGPFSVMVLSVFA